MSGMSSAALLERLIAVPTHNPGGDERALAALCAEELARLGADEITSGGVPREGAVGAWVLARFGTPDLLVNAHLDTVPPNDGWSGDPLVARRVDDRIVGLGACDTKGSIAAILTALAEERPRDTAILFSGDEERTGTVMRTLIARRPGALASVKSAVVCEPTGCRAGVRHRGVLAMEARLDGKGGHSSNADQLPQPIARLARLAVACDTWGRARRQVGPPGFLGMCMNVAALEGGIAFNVVPERAVLHVSVRPPPGASLDEVRAALTEMAYEQVPGVAVGFPVDNPPFATRDVATLAALLGSPETVDLGFWTEAAVLSQAGIDAVVFGPGEIAQAHGADEFVTVAQLEQARSIFAALFRESRTPR